MQISTLVAILSCFWLPGSSDMYLYIRHPAIDIGGDCFGEKFGRSTKLSMSCECSAKANSWKEMVIHPWAYFWNLIYICKIFRLPWLQSAFSVQVYGAICDNCSWWDPSIWIYIYWNVSVYLNTWKVFNFCIKLWNLLSLGKK